MRDDDGSDMDRSYINDIGGDDFGDSAHDLFGDFCVLSPGVQSVELGTVM